MACAADFLVNQLAVAKQGAAPRDHAHEQCAGFHGDTRKDVDETPFVLRQEVIVPLAQPRQDATKIVEVIVTSRMHGHGRSL